MIVRCGADSDAYCFSILVGSTSEHDVFDESMF